MANLQIGNKNVKVQKLTQPRASSGLAYDGTVGFCGIIIRLDGTNSCTLIGVYDNATTTNGDVLLPKHIVIPAGTTLWQVSFAPPVPAYNGVMVAIQSAGLVSYQVKYDDGV